jgi:tetratricopeptide (TPR) repeat protein
MGRNRRKFTNEWDEINYLYDKLLYWLYDQEKPRKALPFGERLEHLLDRVSPGGGDIFTEECRSLLAELRGDLSRAIKHREKAIRLIRKLHELSHDTPHEDYVFRHYDYSDLSDRLDLLAILYHDSGDLEQAIRTLHESKKLCEDHGIKFDGQDLLKDYLVEKQEASREENGWKARHAPKKTASTERPE